MKYRTFGITIDYSKPNRAFMEFEFNEISKIIGRECLFYHAVCFNRPEVVSGNHYYDYAELIVCIFGSVLMRMIDPSSKEVVQIFLSSFSENENAVLVPLGIAHAVRSLGPNKNAVILVFSNKRPGQNDVEHEVIPRDQEHIFIGEE